MAEYSDLIGYLLLGIFLGALPLIVPLFISPRYRGRQTDQTYECGIDTVGSAWVRFDLTFYLFALIFVAFEVDILYLFPIATVFSDFGWRAVIEVALFLIILYLAILYAWRKGVFRWAS